jgi:hypothetical protein
MAADTWVKRSFKKFYGTKLNFYKKKAMCQRHTAFHFQRDYSSFGAPTGQTPAQEPQEIQVSGLISYLPSPSEIAFTGHSEAHAPQEMHSSPILYAI